VKPHLIEMYCICCQGTAYLHRVCFCFPVICFRLWSPKNEFLRF